MYGKIDICKHNKGSSGTVTQQDLSDILILLNSSKYTSRTSATPSFRSSDLDVVMLKLDEEMYDSGSNLSYSQNCHSLVTEILKRKDGWTKISGYIFNRNHMNNAQILLMSHSIVKDSNGVLIELTDLNSPAMSEFIEHCSGSLGINLKAQR